MGTLGLCPLMPSRTVLLGRFARGGAHNRDARLPRNASPPSVAGEMLVRFGKQQPRDGARGLLGFLYGSIGAQANGTIVAAGTDGRYTVLARMLTNGRVDQAFSGDGIAPALVRAASYLPSREVELDRDGKILITGTRPYEDDLVVASSFLKAQQPPGSSRSSRRSRFQGAGAAPLPVPRGPPETGNVAEAVNAED
jgi:hypothetical protein